MTIRTKLTLWYSTVLFALVLVVAGALYYELVIERDRFRAQGRPQEPVNTQIEEVLFFFTVPFALLIVAGGWWLTRKALAPIAEITEAASTIEPERLLKTRLPRSGNGDELDRLCGVFNSMLQRLEESFIREREFTLHASHELKTPLAVMRGEIETALRERSVNVEQQELLSGHLEEIARCASIVDSLAFLAKADAGGLVINSQPILLADLVREAHEDMQTLGLEKQLTVLLDRCDTVTVLGDPQRVRQVLLNLSDNAVKHNIRGGVVKISLRVAGSSAEVLIENSGVTLSAEQTGRAFDRFYRGDLAHDPNKEGCGLGLAIAQSIVKAHGGEIDLSCSQSTTTVLVRLPLMPLSLTRTGTNEATSGTPASA